MMRAMCGVQLKDRKSTKDLMLTLVLNETMGQLAMVNNVVNGMVICGGGQWPCLVKGIRV